MLIGKAIGHEPLESSVGPRLILLDQIDECPGPAKALCGLPRSLSSGMASVEPGIAKRLRAVQKFVLVLQKRRALSLNAVETSEVGRNSFCMEFHC